MALTPAQKRRVVVAGSLVTAVVAVLAVVVQMRPKLTRAEPWPNAWYYDLHSKKLFVSRITNLPPIAAPSGATHKGQPAGVWAVVYSCGSCERDRFIAWLEKLTPETKRQLADVLVQFKDGRGELDPFDAVNLWDQEGRLVALEEESDRWFASTSDEADAMKSESLARCGEGVSPVLCPPVGDPFDPGPEPILPAENDPKPSEIDPKPTIPLPEVTPEAPDSGEHGPPRAAD